MQVIVLKDGTVPVALAKVIHTDGLDDRYRDEVADSAAHNYVETFDLRDDAAAVFVTWADGDGFNVTGFTTLDSALQALFDDDAVQPGDATVVGPGHWAITYDGGGDDDESYGHVFTL